MRHNIHVKLKMQCIQHIFIYPDCKWVTSLLLSSSKLRSFFQLAFFGFWRTPGDQKSEQVRFPASGVLCTTRELNFLH